MMVSPTLRQVGSFNQLSLLLWLLPLTSKQAYEFDVSSTGASYLPSHGWRLVLPSLSVHVIVCGMHYDP